MTLLLYNNQWILLKSTIHPPVNLSNNGSHNSTIDFWLQTMFCRAREYFQGSEVNFPVNAVGSTLEFGKLYKLPQGLLVFFLLVFSLKSPINSYGFSFPSSTSPNFPQYHNFSKSAIDVCGLLTNRKANLTNHFPPFPLPFPLLQRHLSWRKSSCLSSDCLVCSASSPQGHYQLWLANFTKKLVQITSIENVGVSKKRTLSFSVHKECWACAILLMHLLSWTWFDLFIIWGVKLGWFSLSYFLSNGPLEAGLGPILDWETCSVYCRWW